MDSAKATEYTIEVLTAEKDILHQQNRQKYMSVLARYSHYLYIGIALLVTLTVFFLYKRSGYHRRMLLLKKERNSLQQTIFAQFVRMKEEMESKDSEIKQLQLACNNQEGDKLRLEQLNICLNELLKEKRELCIDMENTIMQKEKAMGQLIQEIQAATEIKENIHLNGLLENIRGERNFLFGTLLAAQCPDYRKLLTLKQRNSDNPDNKQKLTEEAWNNLLSEVDLLTHGFVTQLTGKYERLLKEDVYFCCLVKIGMKYSDIASVFGCTPNAVYKRRDAVLRRMNVEIPIKFEFLLEEV